jgi:citrate synthase
MSELINSLKQKALKNNKIEPHWYKDHNIKKGLRNDDGTGVKAILTEISDVKGYKKQDNKVIPIEGELIYRGIEIKNLVNGYLTEKRFGFEETVYLLMFGELPNKKELEEFSKDLAKNRELPEDFIKNILIQFPSKNIMNKLQSNVIMLYKIDKNPNDISVENVIKQCISLIAKFPTIIAYSYQAQNQKEDFFIHQPKEELSTAENFLYMLRQDKQFTQLEAQILDMMLVLHAEHSGGNNSTFTTHCVTSTDTDTYSAIASALGSLKGPKHGGANSKVMSMIKEIKENIEDWDNEEEISNYLKKILNKQAGDGSGLIYGMGHAVYTKSDPRAVLLKEKAKELAIEKDKLNELELYNKIAKLTPGIMSEFKGKELTISPNVDFFSGFIYECLGFSKEIYTALFAMARIAGWSAHRIEEIISGGKIIRPASIYVGPNNIEYKSLEQRE